MEYYVHLRQRLPEHDMIKVLRALRGGQAHGNPELRGSFGFVALLSFAQLISWGALYYSFAVVAGPIERDLGWDKTTVNGAWSVGLLVTGLAAFPVGVLLDR